VAGSLWKDNGSGRLADWTVFSSQLKMDALPSLHGFAANAIFLPPTTHCWRVRCLSSFFYVEIEQKIIITRSSATFKWIYFFFSWLRSMIFVLCVIVHLPSKQFEQKMAVLRHIQNTFKTRSDLFMTHPHDVICRQIDSQNSCFIMLTWRNTNIMWSK
jgi:hypothetical protein